MENYKIKYFNIDTEEVKIFMVSGHRDLEAQLESFGVNPLDPFWVKLGTSDKIPVE